MANLKGIWVLNENPAWEDFGSHNVNFTSNSKTFTSISYGANPDAMDGAALVYANDSETVYAYDFEYTIAWSNEAYKTVDFGTTEQTVDDTFYTWLTANATQQATEEEEPTTSAVTVEYNGLVIATIPNGKIATLSCNGKKMTTDVVIEVPTATDSPLPTEVATEAEMTALLTSGEVGGVYKYTGTTGTYENGALYVLEEETESLIGTWLVNSGWSCPAGYGFWHFDGYTQKVGASNTWSTASGIFFGYEETMEFIGTTKENAILVGYDIYGHLYPQDSFYLVIESEPEDNDGKLSTWLKANNATKQ